VYHWRPDATAAVTVWPAWAWWVVGLLIAAAGLRRRTRRAFAGVGLLWMAFLLVHAEEPWSLPRSTAPTGRWLDAQNQRRAIRVVSLNCAGGIKAAAMETARYQPDIVLLQESPVRHEVEEVGRALFGPGAGVLPGLDASILTRGSIEPVPTSFLDSGFFVHARVRVDGRALDVVSTRLTPPVFREDIWSPSAWRDHRENRHARREQVARLVKHLEGVAADAPLILGGDLNAPQRDAAFDALKPRLRDSFGEGGRGWGNTIINDFPVLRIDQVWVSRHFRAERVIAVKTVHSGHRMVVCDLLFP
jgi:endonuclease/exonuclease/phosphatase (EEP) superfamily protein YafD